MSGSNTFLDTNIFVYAVDRADPAKQRAAQEVLGTVTDACVSPQVMNEFFVVVTRKLAVSLSLGEATAIVEYMSALDCVPTDSGLVLSAVRMGQRWQLSHWDAMMVAAAKRMGCDRILTEDLADGAVYDGVRIENPFAHVN